MIQNKDLNFFRNLTIGTLSSLHNKIQWYNVIDNEKTQVLVPFYFTVSGSERFLSDIFLNSDENYMNGDATGLYNRIPRGILNLTGIVFQEEYLTNKFIRGNHLKEDDCGEIKQYNSEIYELPIKVSFDIVILVDSIIDVFKCTQSVIDNLYKNIAFNVDLDGLRIPCTYSIPSELQNERPVNFSISDKKELKVLFSIELDTLYPIFKEDTSIFAGNKMNTLKANYHFIKDEEKDSSGRTDYEKSN